MKNILQILNTISKRSLYEFLTYITNTLKDLIYFLDNLSIFLLF